jgi:hypothetical protein
VPAGAAVQLPPAPHGVPALGMHARMLVDHEEGITVGLWAEGVQLPVVSVEAKLMYVSAVIMHSDVDFSCPHVAVIGRFVTHGAVLQIVSL